MATVNELLSAVGAVVVGGGFIGAIGAGAVWAFRSFSEKWLNAKFEERLAAFKHEQQKELERLKGEVNAQIDRTTKLHQREFDALAEAWRRLSLAHGIIRSVVSRGQSTPDVGGMGDEQLEDFLTHSKLAEWQRQAVRNSMDKTDEYRNQAEPFKIARAQKTSKKFFVFFRSNGIFIREPIRKRFEQLDGMHLSALSEHQMNFQHGTRSFQAIDKLTSEGEKLFRDLEQTVQSYFWPE